MRSPVPLLVLTLALGAAAPRFALAQAAAPPLTVEDILERAAQDEAAAEPSEDDAETRGLPSAPIPYTDYLSADDLDTRIRGASAAAQTLQGPLDGRWSLTGPDGSRLYALLFVDNGRSALEGAWRDVTRGEGLSATGVIDDLRRDGGALSASFQPRPGQAVSIRLNQMSDGSWSGDLDQAGQRRAVRLLRDEPLLDAAPMFGAAGVVSPYRTVARGPAAAPARRAAAKKKAPAKKKRAAAGKPAAKKKRG